MIQLAPWRAVREEVPHRFAFLHRNSNWSEGLGLKTTRSWWMPAIRHGRCSRIPPLMLLCPCGMNI